MEMTITCLLDAGGPLDGIFVTNGYHYLLLRTNVLSKSVAALHPSKICRIMM